MITILNLLSNSGPYQKITALKGLASLKVQNASVHSVDNLDIDRLVDLFSIEHPVPLYSDVVIRGPVSTKDITVLGNFLFIWIPLFKTNLNI